MFKRLLIPLILFIGLIIPQNASAKKFFDVIIPTVSDTQVVSYVLTAPTAVYTDKIDVSENVGFMSILVELTGGSDDVDISYELSLNGSTWYEPNTTDGTTLTSKTNLVTALTASNWIVIDARLTRFIRFKLDPDANSTITMYVGFQKED